MQCLLQKTPEGHSQKRSEAEMGRQTLEGESSGRDDGEGLANLQGGLQHLVQGREDPHPPQELEGISPSQRAAGRY